jgi:hypothetical protein
MSLQVDVLNTWFPNGGAILGRSGNFGGAILRGSGNFRRWNLDGGSKSWEVCPWWCPLPFFFFFFVALDGV